MPGCRQNLRETLILGKALNIKRRMLPVAGNLRDGLLQEGQFLTGQGVFDAYVVRE